MLEESESRIQNSESRIQNLEFILKRTKKSKLYFVLMNREIWSKAYHTRHKNKAVFRTRLNSEFRILDSGF
jgi:hypothetical protein